MSENENEFDADSGSFKKIRDYLEGGEEHRKVSIGLMATAIEERGIYTWDRFGRFRKADEDAKKRILNLLARIYEYENDCYDPHTHDEHPLEEASFMPDDPFSLFGWVEDDLPDFKAIAEKELNVTRPKHVDTRPQDKTAFKRKSETYLIIIKALLNKAKIDPEERGAAPKIAGIVHEAGLNRNEGTIKTVLDEIKESQNYWD